MKKFTMIIICLFIAISPIMTFGNFSFASSGSAWVACETHEDIVAAFKAYCKHRNFTKETTAGNHLLQAIVAYDYDQLEKACTLLNIDLEGLNAEVWYAYNNSGKLKFFISKTGLYKFGLIYSALLQQYNMSNNSPEVKTIYNNELFYDDNGYSCYVYKYKKGTNRLNCNLADKNEYFEEGTLYKWNGVKYFYDSYTGSAMPYALNYNNTQYTYWLITLEDAVLFNNSSTSNFDVARAIYANQQNGYKSKYGWTCIYKWTNNRYYLGSILLTTNNSQGANKYFGYTNLIYLENITTTDVTITAETGTEVQVPDNVSIEITTNDTTINNYITNNDSHDTYNYSDDDEPSDKPKQKPVPPDSVTTDPNNPSLPTGIPDINFQMPNLNIDWNLDLDINNLPFPFSIPYDIIRFLTILDSDPEAPKYEIHTEIFDNPIDLEIDLSVFDDGMEIIRNIILVGYVIFLIVSTRALFHIY